MECGARTVFPLSMVVGAVAVVPAAVCLWGLCPRCLGWVEVSLVGGHIIII